MSAALQRLLAWLSPAFPTGGFAWSQGLETGIADGRIASAPALADWIGGALAHGALKTDAVLLAAAHRAPDAPALAELAELALALAPAAERRSETLLTGQAFVAAARAWPSPAFARLPDPCPYPIAVGALTCDLPLTDTLAAFLTLAVQVQISVAVRLVPLGQTAGLKTLAALEPKIATLAAAATTTTLDGLGAIAYAADIAQMRHEIEEPRIFRS